MNHRDGWRESVLIGKPQAYIGVGQGRDEAGKGQHLAGNNVERIFSASNQQYMTVFNNTEESAH